VKRVGILGLPASGKTTLFEILVEGAGAHPATSGREHVGVVTVPDTRIDELSRLFQPRKTTFTQIQFVDSVAAGQAGRPGKGPDPFASVRTADALLAVVRSFENPAVPAAQGVDPARDLRALEAELILNDLAIVETRLERIEKERRIGKKEHEREHTLLLRCKTALEQEHALRAETFDAEETRLLRGFQMLSRKPLLVVVNDADDASGKPVPEPGPGTLQVRLRAHLEREIVGLPRQERDPYRRELGVEEDGLSLVIRSCYQLLGLVSFFTVGPDEVRSWTLSRGETAVDAAGEIHTDLAKGFIRAEVVGWQTLVEQGWIAGARTKGLLRLEGRDYIVQDGDCVEIRFNRT
jgi:GTP-binding protein YchF